MSSSDPIADMLTRVRNAIMGGQQLVSMPSSKLKIEIAKILHSEGYIEEYEESQENDRKTLRMKLKYVGERRSRRPVITGLKRVSRPGRRAYVGKSQIPWVQSGMGVAILTTPKGVMTGTRAKQLGVGGELLCEVW
ncbi:MAG: 30S ribosomal protein S8 [Chloroflexi bacterium]|nr:30S ribosomal protein S8 [Chloroflexota bacterium]